MQENVRPLTRWMPCMLRYCSRLCLSRSTGRFVSNRVASDHPGAVNRTPALSHAKALHARRRKSLVGLLLLLLRNLRTQVDQALERVVPKRRTQAQKCSCGQYPKKPAQSSEVPPLVPRGNLKDRQPRFRELVPNLLICRRQVLRGISQILLLH